MEQIALSPYSTPAIVHPHTRIRHSADIPYNYSIIAGFYMEILWLDASNIGIVHRKYDIMNDWCINWLMCLIWSKQPLANTTARSETSTASISAILRPLRLKDHL